MWKLLTDFAAKINTPPPVKSPVCCDGKLTFSHTETLDIKSCVGEALSGVFNVMAVMSLEWNSCLNHLSCTDVAKPLPISECFS